MGKDLGYAEKKLQDFVKQQQDYERGERIAEGNLKGIGLHRKKRKGRIGSRRKVRKGNLKGIESRRKKLRQIRKGNLKRLGSRRRKKKGRISSRRKKKLGKST